MEVAEKRYDLHTHTNCSDGIMTPQELLCAAKEAGLFGLSITDHDTVSAYTPLLFEQAFTLGIDLITGVEFSCMHGLETVHILGYGVDHRMAELKDFCDRYGSVREIRNQKIIDKLKKKGFKVTYEDLLVAKVNEYQVLGRPHIAKLLLERGHVKTMGEAFERYLGEGRSCYVAPITPSIHETIAMIHAARGVAILAHPHLFKKKRVLKEILKYPFDGLECYYARTYRDVAESFVKICREKGWLVTGGSDFHGSQKYVGALGSSFIQGMDAERFLNRIGRP
jgi:predicted metal-dependent phosphoesterase TrpH